MYWIDRYNDESNIWGLFNWESSYRKCIWNYISVRLRDKVVIFITKWNVVFGTVLLFGKNGKEKLSLNYLINEKVSKLTSWN